MELVQKKITNDHSFFYILSCTMSAIVRRCTKPHFKNLQFMRKWNLFESYNLCFQILRILLLPVSVINLLSARCKIWFFYVSFEIHVKTLVFCHCFPTRLRPFWTVTVNIFPEVDEIPMKYHFWFCERAILTPTNDQTFRINQTLGHVSSWRNEFISINTTIDEDYATNVR